MPASSPRRVLVVAGGDVALVEGLALVLPRCDVVVAADSGVHHALTLGLTIDIVVGDFDSVRREAVDEAVAAGAVLEQFPVTKDQTDLELALDRACGLAGPGGRVVVVASVAGRLDHGLANLLVLASPAYAACEVEAYVDRWHVSVLRNETRRMPARVGAIVTLLVLGPEAAIVGTEGLQYPLNDELVHRSSTRGVSNVAIADEIEVRVDGGVLLALREWAD